MGYLDPGPFCRKELAISERDGTIPSLTMCLSVGVSSSCLFRPKTVFFLRSQLFFLFQRPARSAILIRTLFGP